MADSIRERIIQEFQYYLSGLTIAEGFNTDCGRLIERGKMQWDEEDSPCMSLFPGVETASQAVHGRDTMVMPITLNLFETYTDTTSIVTGKPVSGASVKGEKMLADAREAAKRAFRQLTQGLAQGIAYKGGGIQEYPDLSKKTIGVLATFEIEYETKRGNPYEQ